MKELVPKLKVIEVESGKLLLDPNNPRFITDEKDKIPTERISDVDTINETHEKMLTKKDLYRIHELMDSIRENGWQPVDSIFVRPTNNDMHIVLEGNRRVTAVRELLKDKELPADLRNSLHVLEVMEVQGLKDDESMAHQIEYLLGVRHHGSLKTWSPFAQARNIFGCYLEVEGISDEAEFVWEEEAAEKVAKALSIPAKGKRSVEERLSVYQAMVSVGDIDDVGKGRIKDHYYSLFSDMLSQKDLRDYLVRDPKTLRLEAESAQKMDDLCSFSNESRSESAIPNPREWGKLAKIIGDENTDKANENLQRVEVGKEQPSIVWAQREEELKKLEWASWLRKLSAIIGRVTISEVDINDEEARSHIADLTNLLHQLEEQI